MDFDQFLELYRPKLNHLDTNASVSGLAFETYGSEVEFVREQPQDVIWTCVETDNDEMILIPGFHHVNRMYYMITEKPWTDDTIEVVVVSKEDLQELEQD